MHLSRLTRAINHVRVTVLVTSVILMLQCLYINTSAQHSQVAQPANQTRDERVQQILESLEQDNTLRFALEKGDRGSGMHYAWMDKMRQQSVKQASFRIHFQWGKRKKKVKITDIKYLRHYYRFDRALNDQSILEQIRASGLEQELRNEILRRVKANLTQRTREFGSSQICGTLYLNLLDEEVLPILDEPPDIDEDCKTTCGRKVCRTAPLKIRSEHANNANEEWGQACDFAILRYSPLLYC